VLQELLHLYLGVERLGTLDAALELVRRSVGVTWSTWSIEAEDVLLARALVGRHPGLSARDLVHLACCTRREVSRVKTFDRALGAAMGETAGG
jgi:hypothetical protein